jgi:hypothetical protein
LKAVRSIGNWPKTIKCHVIPEGLMIRYLIVPCFVLASCFIVSYIEPGFFYKPEKGWLKRCEELSKFSGSAWMDFWECKRNSCAHASLLCWICLNFSFLTNLSILSVHRSTVSELSERSMHLETSFNQEKVPLPLFSSNFLKIPWTASS